MDAQVLLAAQVFQNGVGNGADTQLQGGTVLHQLRDVFADGVGDLVNGAAAQLRQRRGGLHEIIELGDMEEGIPHGAGHLVVDLSDGQLRVENGGLCTADADAQRHKAVLVRRSD